MTAATGPSSPPRITPLNATGFTVGMLLLVAALLAWYSHSRVEDFRANQQQLMQATVDATATEISLYLSNLHRQVSLFTQDRSELIRHLAEHPDDSDAYQRLKTAIATHFPNHFAFTIANHAGKPLLEGRDKLVGKGCRRDIKAFADKLEAHRLYIHSSPEQNPYHFDIMVPWSNQGEGMGVFFASFFVHDLSEIIASEQRPGDELIIVREDRPKQIELTADGARDEIPRDSQLGADELADIIVDRQIKNTRWILLALPDPVRLRDFQATVRFEAVFVFLLFSMAALLMLCFVRRYESALRSSNRELATSLSDLRETQQHLVESEKLAALGGLVAGVAHEINTPVGIAITAVSHLQEEQQQTSARLRQGQLKKSQLDSFIDTSREATRIALSNLQRAADLVRSFKLVSSDQTHQERRQFELCDYLGEILLSLRPKLKHTGHELNIDCPGSIDMHSYPGALAQIITNLLDNALLHAFPDASEGHINISVIPQDRQVHIVFADDGVGMDSETVAKVFEPFFTRNRDRGGTGLGLHIVYNLVNAKLHGRIHCDSTPGAGTRFQLDLPLLTPENANEE